MMHIRNPAALHTTCLEQFASELDLGCSDHEVVIVDDFFGTEIKDEDPIPTLGHKAIYLWELSQIICRLGRTSRIADRVLDAPF